MRYLSLIVLLGLSSACVDDADTASSDPTDQGTDVGSSDTPPTTETDSAPDDSGENTSSPEPSTADYAFVLPLSNNETTWHDLAFLATIPTASKLNNKRPVVLGAEDVNSLPSATQDFLNRYTPTHGYVLEGDGSSLASVGTTHSL
ncbi:MAG: hypothetical protein VX834_04960, partial [Myxococcota bacterium]|nr:hypothetical protein [Myxococcota bacterium]